eukprot:5305678-Pyramimonas_sp.AAC.1
MRWIHPGLNTYPLRDNVRAFECFLLICIQGRLELHLLIPRYRRTGVRRFSDVFTRVHTLPASAPVAPIITRTLKTAEPTIVAMPMESSADGFISDIIEANSSGAEDPAAMNVAPATSSDRCRESDIFSSDGTKKSSHTTDNPKKSIKIPIK